jgi:uncharacterized membrane protein YhaH (DUF805 family)
MFSDVFRFSISGRTSRRNYWCALLVYALIGWLMSAVSEALLNVTISESLWNASNSVIYWIGIFVQVLVLLVTIRRLHDISKSGWWVLFFLIPVVGWIANLILGFIGSAPGENRWGPNPYGVSDPFVQKAKAEQLAELLGSGAISQVEYDSAIKRIENGKHD